MKKTIGLMLILLSVITLFACGNKKDKDEDKAELTWDRIPMLMVEDKLYLDTGEQIPVEIDDSAIIGTITSEVDASEYPSKNGESNFGSIGAEYAYYKDGLAVLLNNEWQFFRKELSSLSLEKIIELSEKGEDLSWEDFEKYDSIEVGSGLYIRVYGIDEDYSLLVGGASIEEKPWYIRLAKTNNLDDYIDIRTDDINDFIAE